MKRIIAFVIAATLCLFALVSCGGGGETVTPDTTLADITAMYRNSAPTKTTAVTTQIFADTKFVSTKILTVGTVTDATGTYEAAIFDNTEEELRNVTEGGASEEILDKIKADRQITLYVEGKGTKKIDPETGKAVGRWNPDSEMSIPERGDIAIFLDSKVITEFTYEDGVLSFSVPAANTLAILGTEIPADVAVTITNEGAVVTGITISYEIAADEENGVAAGTVEIKVAYSYDIEPINY